MTTMTEPPVTDNERPIFVDGTTAGRFSIGLNDRERAIAAEERAEVLAAQLQQAREALAELRTYIIYTRCPECGLPDPTRYAADCEQCDKARAALAAAAPATIGLDDTASSDELTLMQRWVNRGIVDVLLKTQHAYTFFGGGILGPPIGPQGAAPATTLNEPEGEA